MGKREDEFYKELCERIREKEREVSETEVNSPGYFHLLGALRALERFAEFYRLMFLSEERRLLIKKASAFHVPGHGPEFDAMTNGQIAQHIERMEEAFKLTFEKLDAERAGEK
ncbi:hypothetical protein ACINLE_17575 [Bacillus sp. z60-18]|uniref:hypothetical protein n=1 Tax=unclassified Bacillus (in: firmicutes) TaxID=185979 RepID=UPI00390CBDC2